MSIFIVWLDDGINQGRANKLTTTRIRQLNGGRLKTFTDRDECVDYMTSLELPDRIILISSNKLGCVVFPLVHELPQLTKAYIYCRNRAAAEQWAKSFRKFSGVFTKENELTRAILNDVYDGEAEAKLSFSIFNVKERENSLQNLSKDNARFMWYRAILHAIPFMAEYGDAKNELIAECQAQYQNNSKMLAFINKFEKEYTPERAIDWYQKDPCLFRILNAALCTQETEVIYKFRLFINELHNAIKTSYDRYLDEHVTATNNHLTLYRGQYLTKEDVQILRANNGNLIVMNNFLDVSLERNVADLFGGLDLLCDEDSGVQPVLFVIELFNMRKDTTPFSVLNDDRSTGVAGDKEVLFSIGAAFKVTSVLRRGSTWEVRLRGNREQDTFYTDLVHHLLKDIGSEPGPVSFGWFLFRMNEFERAEKFVLMLLKHLPEKHRIIGEAYYLLGSLYKERDKISKSIEYYERALSLYSEIKSGNSASIIAIHCDLAFIYLESDNMHRAADEYDKAKKQLEKSPGQNDPSLQEKVFSVQGRIQFENGQYEDALKSHQQSLKLKKQALLPEDHPSTLSTIHDIGIVQEKLGNDTEALKSLLESLKLSELSSPNAKLYLAETHVIVGHIYFKKKSWKNALKHYRNSMQILQNDCREHDEHIAQVQEFIKNTEKQAN